MLAPIPMIGAAVALMLMLDIAALQYLANLPHPDQTLEVRDGHVVLRETGDPVRRLVSERDAIELRPGDFLEEPDVLPNTAELRDFFERQGRIVAILGDANPAFVTESGRVEVSFHDEPLPATARFWIQLLVANLGFLIGVAVWTFQRSNPAARHFCVTGIGLACAAMAAGIYSSRPIAMHAVSFETLSWVNIFGTQFFCCGFLAMIWNYPRPLFRVPLAPYWYALMLAPIGLEYSGLLTSLDISRRLPALFTLFCAVVVLVWQWRLSEGNPLTRQMLKWFFLVTISGSTLFCTMVMVPPLFSDQVIVSQAAAFLAFLIIYLGLALGVVRYPLFDLQQYWTKTLIWLLGGLVVIALNLVIVQFYGLSNITAMVMILVSLAVVYVPLRALDARYVFNRASKNFQEHLPLIVSRMSRYQGAELADVWEKEIIEIFRPLESEKASIQVVKPVVAKGGLGLVIPGIQGGVSYHLAYADQGTRLFNSLDVILIETLTGLFEMTATSGNAARTAAEAERGRLRRDLHDTLGGRLLTIMHSSEDGRVAAESRHAMGELREILAGIDSRDSRFEEARVKWEDQLREQCEAMNVSLTFTCTNPDGLDLNLPGQDRFNLGQILREAVTNAIRHAQATEVAVDLDLSADQLRVTVSNNGNVVEPGQWREGYGTRNIQERAAELDANINWQLADGRLSVQLWLSLDRWGPTPRSGGA